MHLVIVATDASLPQDSSVDPHWTVRLMGMAEDAETPPPGLMELADEAAQEIRSTFPLWMWNWLQEAGMLNLHSWSKWISWWWYTPLSEKSPLRSPLIRELYWIALVRRLLQKIVVDSIHWIGQDPAFCRTVEQVVKEFHVPFRATSRPSRDKRKLSYFAYLRVRHFLSAFLKTVLLKIYGFGRVGQTFNLTHLFY